LLSAEELAGMQNQMNILVQAINGTNKDEINRCMDELNSYSSPFAHRAMDVAIADAMKGKHI